MPADYADSLQTPQTELARRVAAAVEKATGVRADPLVAPSQNPQFGDYQSNAAMGLAGRLSKERGEKVNPRQVATDVVAALDADDLLAEPPQIAGPGFINFKLAPQWVAAKATAALADDRLGLPTVTQAQTVVVEYSSPNIAKQMHVGHIRSTILGDAAARLLDHLGHTVIRQNHVGDWGTQFGMLTAFTQDLFERILQNPVAAMPEAAQLQAVDDNDPYAFLGNFERTYQLAKKRFDESETFRDRSRQNVVKLQAGDPQVFGAWQSLVEVSRTHYSDIYARLGVSLESVDERGESFYNPRLPSLVDDLQAAGIAEESDGALVSFAGGFKSPLMIRKSDGGFGYGTTDLAACEFRGRCDRIEAYERDGLCVDRSIYFVDARQAQHFKQVFATAKAAADVMPAWSRLKDVEFEHASFGSVLGEGGTPLKTREGGTVKLADLLDEAEARARKVVDEASPHLSDDEKTTLAQQVGIGAVKYADLSKDRTSDYVFSFDDMLRLDGNSGPYMQYAHARVQSVLRKAADAGVTGDGKVTTLKSPQEIALAKQLLSFGDSVASTARELKPHLLCLYLYETARAFSRFWESCPVLQSEGDVQSSRLALAELTGKTLAAGLDLLGIAHPDRM